MLFVFLPNVCKPDMVLVSIYVEWNLPEFDTDSKNNDNNNNSVWLNEKARKNAFVLINRLEFRYRTFRYDTISLLITVKRPSRVT